MEFILITLVFVIMVTVIIGAFANRIVNKRGNDNFLKLAIKVNMVVVGVLMVTAIVAIFTTPSMAAEAAEVASETVSDTSFFGIGLLSAAISTGIACIGAGIAVAVASSAALGAISENPSILGKTLIFVGLAEGIAIYGLIISIMILGKIK